MGDQVGAPGLWAFSNAVYVKSGVKAACLALQDAGLDVNIALFVIWLTATDRDPDPVLERALALSHDWRARVVQKLRDARDGLKPAPDYLDADAAQRLRQQILEVELASERTQQTLLEHIGQTAPKLPGSDRRGQALKAIGTASSGQVETSIAAHFVKTVFDAFESV